MRVLITNNHLAPRGGVETVVRQLARGLQARGHSVIAYSSDLRQGERLLETDVIPVATDLENLPFRPDVIHGQHHLDAMTALNGLPDVPAVYHCHGAVWRGWCPAHPRIYRYLTVSRTMRERIATESNVDPARIDVFLNSVAGSVLTGQKPSREIRQGPALQQPTRARQRNRHCDQGGGGEDRRRTRSVGLPFRKRDR